VAGHHKTFTYFFIASSLILFVGAAFYFVAIRGPLSLGSKKPEGSLSQTVLPRAVTTKDEEKALPDPEEETEPTSSVPILDPIPEEEPLLLPEDVESELSPLLPPPPPPAESPPPLPPPSPSEPPPPLPEEPAYQPKTHIVSIENNGFVPKILTITLGDTITWINNDPVLHWPSSDPHPTHTGLPDFDPLSDLLPEESYSYTFIKIGTFPYHDHTQAVEDDEATITGGVRVLPEP